MPSYRNLTAPQLVTHWKKIVNDNINIGRDSHLFKDFLLRATSTQILLGMYRFEGQYNITIPIFLREYQQWLELDDGSADIELAMLITHKVPPAYYTWKELKDEQDSWAFSQAQEAKSTLKEWADRILA